MDNERLLRNHVLVEKDNIVNDSDRKNAIALIKRRRRKTVKMKDTRLAQDIKEGKLEDNSIAKLQFSNNSLSLISLPLVIDKTDTFCIEQSFCTICGSSGIEEEAVSLRCIQCCQEYHSYCLNYTTREYSINQGWRCPECQTCNVCKFENSSKSTVRCKACNMIYHTDCAQLKDKIPVSWLCPSCTKYETEERATNECNKCHVNFMTDDLIIFCPTCQKWLHGSCVNIHSKDLENLSESFTQCSNCLLTQKRSIEPITNTSYQKPFDATNNYNIKENLWGIISNITLYFYSSFDGYLTETRRLTYLLNKLYYSNYYLSEHGRYEYEQNISARRQCDVILLDVLNECYKSIYSYWKNINENKLFNYNDEYILGYIAKLYFDFMYNIQYQPNDVCLYKMYELEKYKYKIMSPVRDDDITNKNTILYYINQTDESSYIASNSEITPVPINSFPKKSIIHKYYKKSDAKVLSNFIPCSPTNDNRKCVLCHECGDTSSSLFGRLLFVSLNKWIHVICAIYSQGVRIDNDGSIHNIEKLILKCSKIICIYCSKYGASFSCNCISTIHETSYAHVRCILNRGHSLHSENNTIICPCDTKIAIKKNETFILKRYFIYSSMEDRLLLYLQNLKKCCLKISNLIIFSIGSIHWNYQSKLIINRTLLSLNYKCSKKYWDFDSNKKQHSSTTSEVLRVYNFNTSFSYDINEIIYTINSGDYSSTSISSFHDIWKPIISKIKIKMNSNLYFSSNIDNFLKIFGFKELSVITLLESFDAVDHFNNYQKFTSNGHNNTYNNKFNTLLPIVTNPSGSIRSEQIITNITRVVIKIAKNNISEPLTATNEEDFSETNNPANSTNNNTNNNPNNNPNNSTTNCTQTKKLELPKSLRCMQYRIMKEEYIKTVRVQKSFIHGYGLFAMQDFQPNTMIMEYVGCIIRNEIANIKEKQYEKENRGVYMFKLDSEYIVDATLYGGPARFVNHSCDPNCTAEIITVDKIKKIVIVSIKYIKQNEEITYNYQMDFEENDKKLECCCGSFNCRKWLN